MSSTERMAKIHCDKSCETRNVLLKVTNYLSKTVWIIKSQDEIITKSNYHTRHMTGQKSSRPFNIRVSV